MKQEALNRLRRMAGLPQDFSYTPPAQPVVESDKFAIVMGATPDSRYREVYLEMTSEELRGLILEVAHMISEGAPSTLVESLEVFPFAKANVAKQLAKDRLAEAAALDENVGVGIQTQVGSTTSNPDNFTHPRTNDSELNWNTDYEQEEDTAGEDDAREERQQRHYVITAVRAVIQHLRDELQHGAHNDMYEKDLSSYQHILSLVVDGHQDTAATAWRQLSTSARELLPSAIGSNREARQHVYDYFDIESLHDDVGMHEGVTHEENSTNMKLGTVTGLEESKAEKFDTGHKFEKGDKVRYKGKKMVVAVPDAKANFVGITPPGKQNDKDAVDLVRVDDLRLDKKEAAKKEETNDEFSKGDIVKHKGKEMVVTVPDAKADFVGVAPKGKEDDDDAVDLVRADELTKVDESMHYYSDNTYSDSHVDHDTQPTNVSAPYDTVYDQEKEDDKGVSLPGDDEKATVPPAILRSLKKTIDTLKAEVKKTPSRDHERASYYSDTADVFQEVHDCLSKKTIEGVRRAQNTAMRMLNVQRALMPDSVWQFIVNGGKKRSLKDYMNDVKGTEYPITGPRNTLD